MSAVLASRLDPGTITVLKGNKPLCLRIHRRQHRVVLYASRTTPLSTLPWTTRRAGASWRCRP